ncbi:MAG TPA: hypothetical protein VGQ73_08225, partial [Gemmatimonadales bacterium]|nr:hypothetical protein [Gemmatimonadales bacterium]
MIDDPQQAASRRNGNTAESIDALTLVSSAEVGRDISRPADRPPERRGALGRWPRRLRLAPRDAVADGLALCVLTVGVLVSFRESLAAGLVAFQKDTQIFYYPLQLWFAEEFKAGRFPLWNPYIFAGYPIFADGEVGLAYPLHLALLRLLPVAQAFIWLRISSVLVAALGMYALCRALRLGRVPATLGALTFSLGSFFLSQQHHEDVTRTAAWLPLVLACTEWGLHRAGWRRHLFFTAAAGALAMSALGLHPQVLAMSLLGFATFVIFRVLAGPSPYHLAARLALTIWIGGYVGGIGLGLACVQLLPLAEIGAATYRGSAPDYFFATSYALPMQNLVNLVFPYFFRGPDSEYWSLWAKWETALYVGLVPLLLGLMGMMLARRREVIYFAGLSVLALWLAFAAYAPYDLYEVLWSIPGFSSFRVPGRYVYLFVLAWSVLAAFGLQALARDAGEATGSRGKELWLRAFPPAVRNLFPVLLLAIGALAGVWLMGNLRASLTADEAGSLDWIRTSYLSLRHHAEGIEPIAAYDGLVYSLDPATPRTAFGLIMLAVALALAAGLALANRHRAWLWQGALVGAAAIDLVLFGVGFHQKLPVGQLSQGTPAIQFLQCEVRRADCGAEFGPESVVGGPPSAVQEWRVFTSGTSPSLESNRLVPFRVQDIGGYSSLESRRNYTYWTTIAG